MSRMQRLSVEIPAEVNDIVKAAVASGEFASASEMVASAVADWRSSKMIHGYTVDELRALVKEGKESGEPIDGGEAFRQITDEFEREFGAGL